MGTRGGKKRGKTEGGTKAKQFTGRGSRCFPPLNDFRLHARAETRARVHNGCMQLRFKFYDLLNLNYATSIKRDRARLPSFFPFGGPGCQLRIKTCSFMAPFPSQTRLHRASTESSVSATVFATELVQQIITALPEPPQARNFILAPCNRPYRSHKRTRVQGYRLAGVY